MQLKTLGYLDSIMAAEQAREAGFDEPLMLNTHSRVACTGTGNLFVLRGDRLFTPPPLLRVAPGLGLQVVEDQLTLEDLIGADTVPIPMTLPEIAGDCHRHRPHLTSARSTRRRRHGSGHPRRDRFGHSDRSPPARRHHFLWRRLAMPRGLGGSNPCGAIRRAIIGPGGAGPDPATSSLAGRPMTYGTCLGCDDGGRLGCFRFTWRCGPSLQPEFRK